MKIMLNRYINLCINTYSFSWWCFTKPIDDQCGNLIGFICESVQHYSLKNCLSNVLDIQRVGACVRFLMGTKHNFGLCKQTRAPTPKQTQTKDPHILPWDKTYELLGVKQQSFRLKANSYFSVKSSSSSWHIGPATMWPPPSQRAFCPTWTQHQCDTDHD